MSTRESTVRKARLAAQMYNNEADRAPIQTVARDLNVHERTAMRLVRIARERGWITRTSRTGPTKNPLVHGTYHGYKKHGCRCAACTSANNSYHEQFRRRRFARRETAAFEHGAGGYSNWGCRCSICNTAHTDLCRVNQRKRVSRSAEAPHGTRTGYDSWGCRCDPCRIAKVTAQREWRHRKKASA